MVYCGEDQECLSSLHQQKEARYYPFTIRVKFIQMKIKGSSFDKKVAFCRCHRPQNSFVEFQSLHTLAEGGLLIKAIALPPLLLAETSRIGKLQILLMVATATFNDSL